MASSTSAPSVATEPEYRIKRVQFFGRESVPIFMQNVNGPCPLLALVRPVYVWGPRMNLGAVAGLRQARTWSK